MRGIVGIDPGAHGACAIFCPEQSVMSGLRWQILDMPVVENKGKRELNPGVLRDWLRRFDPAHVYLELISAPASFGHGAESGEEHKTATRRGMGAAGAFRYGGIYFSIKAVVACCDVPLTLITPQSWKKAHGIKGSDKEVSRQRALQLFPDQSSQLARVKDEARAEAMLIAEVGARLQNRQRAAA